MTPLKLWERFCRNHCACSELGFSLDISRMHFADGFLDEHAELANRALDAMADLESGAIANPDEHRMVGHYWLRAPELAPKPEIRTSIEECVQRIKGFAEDVHNGRIAPPGGGHFENLLLIGIGGSTLGPQFIDDALRSADDPLLFWSFDNTDPDGFDRTLARIGNALPRTLVLVISKSGGTKETRNGMLEAKHAYESAGLDFAKHAVAVTGEGSALYETAKAEGWIDTFPMWDWVGGRTSLTAAVGLLPAALQGFDIDALLDGARKMDTQTRTRTVRENPAMLMALMWYDAAKNRGRRDMVIIPYKDRLTLFSRYLQQLIMESIGKERDLDGNVVHEGIAVYGNKGSTDQHAYVQQLRDGLNNFHVTFVEVLRSRKGLSIEVEPGMTSGNFLHGFLQGTRAALAEGGRESMTITIDEVDAQSVGTLIALFERAVGFYASMTNINAYHQPGVEAGKKAAGEVLTLQMQVFDALRDSGQEMTSAEVAERIGATSRVEDIYLILRRFSAEVSRGVSSTNTESPQDARFQFEN